MVYPFLAGHISLTPIRRQKQEAAAMNLYVGMTLRQARSVFHTVYGMPVDGGYTARWWSMRLGWFSLLLPNFKWRRCAVPYHDLHHILTGYPCSPAGEMQMAAWEFAAGRYPHPLATAFCLPLVGTGAVLFPRRTFAAFLLGRRSATLYRRQIDPDLLNTRVCALRKRQLPREAHATTIADRAAYLVLVLSSIALMLLPITAALLMWGFSAWF
jgi:hypothetical protein